MSTKANWRVAIRPLLKKYKGKKHPLEYGSLYQLIVMVVISAQSTDKLVNERAHELFKAFPDMSALSKVTSREQLFPYLQGIRNFAHKADWLIGIAREVRKDAGIPLTLDKLTALPGIGRKSANVILREAGRPPEGIIVDLHVMRVAPRLGIADGKDPKKMEEQLMEKLPKAEWDAGMAMSFLGREICKPKPECPRCLMNRVCTFYQESK
ncbi:MAG TPA: endonuclease III [Puia sp.]|jgi:endonuclease-3|nr:endonuclease III [Puia sp.]